MSPISEKRFDIVFEAQARSSGKMRNDISLRFTRTNECYELATDEGAFHGGDGTAPPPLAPFAAALVGCVMTQIRAFATRLRMRVRAVNVQARLHWQAVQQAQEPYVSAPVGFQLDIELETDEPVEAQQRLIDAAKKGCFIEATLARPNIVTHRLRTPHGWRDI